MLNRAKNSGRVDDTQAIFDKRYQGFLDESKDIIRFSEQKQMLFKVIITLSIRSQERSVDLGIFRWIATDRLGISTQRLWNWSR